MDPLIITTTKNKVRTLRFNNPAKLNGWSLPMMDQMLEGLAEAGKDADVEAVIITGTGKYYSAGVDFGGALKPMAPSALEEMVRASNQRLFDAFIDFPKPLFAAMNGPGIGAAVTSATLCDAIVASETVTLLTPFKTLGLVPEGCSSYNFPKMLGEEMAKEVLEGKKLSAQDALKLGLVCKVVPQDQVVEVAQTIAEDWVKANQPRNIVKKGIVAKLKAVNAEESIALAKSILALPFLQNQARFAYAKGKYFPWLLFTLIAFTRPLWSKL